MKFGNPYWLWGILILPIAYVLLVFDEKRRQNQFAKFADRKLWTLIAPEMDWSLRLRKGTITLVAFAFALLALARPQFGSHEETVQVSGLDVMLVLDVSSSMDAEDVVPSRLLKAKHMIRSLVSRLGGDRVGVVAFAYSSFVACPLTTDLDYVLDTVQILGPKSVQNQGTDIGTALDTAYKSLDRGAQEVSPSQAGAPPSRVIILISDGEDHEDQALIEARKIKSGGAKLYVLGIGTEKGGPIPVKEGEQSQEFKKDRQGESVITKFKPEYLMNVATSAGGKYWNVTSSEDEVQELIQDLGPLGRTDYAERRYLVYEDRFQIPLFIAIVLLFWEISIPARKLLVCLPMFFPILMGAVFAYSPSVKADGFLKKPAPLDSYLENQKGIEAYREGRLEDALKEFGSAQARDPKSPELEFNQGVVQMQKGDTDRAVEAFKNSIQGGLEKNDHNLVGKSFYNLGNALSKKGDMKGAVRSYLGAIDAASRVKNIPLEEEARKNLQLLVNEAKKQQQQQQQQEKDQQQKKQEQQQQEQQQEQKKSGQDSKQEDQKKQEQKSEDQKQQDKQQAKSDQDRKQENQSYQETKKENGKQQFRSLKMDQQDAERVLSELTNRERELQEKLNNQNARVQNGQPKDWTAKDW